MSEHIYMPNEIFNDLKQSIGNSSHIAFAYGYYYYITYLYRYCKHVMDDNRLIGQGDIKSALGYAEDNKTVDYIIKRGGVLDSIGYTEPSTNYPILSMVNEHGLLGFAMKSDAKEDFLSRLNDRNARIKVPIKALYRTEESAKQRELDGTFYSVENTHQIESWLFADIMGNSKLNVTALYLYAFLNYTKDKSASGGVTLTHAILAERTGLSVMTVRRTIKALAETQYIYEFSEKKDNYKRQITYYIQEKIKKV